MKLNHKKIRETLLSIEDKETGYGKKVLMKLFQLPNGLNELFFVDKDKDSVCILPITTDKKVILVEQFRPGIEKKSIELCGGGLEGQEDPLKAAERELKEECGLKSLKGLKHLATLPYSPYSTGKRYCYLALDCKKISEVDLDPNEFLNVIMMSLDEFKNRIKKAEIRGFEVGYLALDLLDSL